MSSYVFNGVHAVDLSNEVALNILTSHIGQLETQSIDHKLLFSGCQGVVEQTRLRPYIGECWTSGPNKVSAYGAPGGGKEAISDSLVGLFRRATVQSVW